MPVPTGDYEHAGVLPAPSGDAGAVGETQESPGAKRLWDEKRRDLWTLPCPTAACPAPGSCPAQGGGDVLSSRELGSPPPWPRHVTEDRIPSLLSFAPAAAKPVDV